VSNKVSLQRFQKNDPLIEVGARGREEETTLKYAQSSLYSLKILNSKEAISTEAK
jgi:hypothetical protein